MPFLKNSCAAIAAATVFFISACGGGGSPSAGVQPPPAPTPTPTPVTSVYTVSTFAGDDGQTFVDGTRASARFDAPSTMAKDSAGNFYVSDGTAIRRITPTGIVSTLAVIGSVPRAMAMDAADNLYVADTTKFRVLKIAPNGVVSTFAGNSTRAGYADGAADVALFSAPQGIAVDATGNVYVSESRGSFEGIRRITPSGVVSTLAGATAAGLVDGNGTAARFDRAMQLAVDSAATVYVVDAGGTAIRKVTATGVVTTLLGGPGASSGANVDQIPVFGIAGVAVDAAGNIYVTDQSTVRKITPAGAMSILAGDSTGLGGLMGFADGAGKAARFALPVGIVVDAAGNLQVADSRNRAIRTVTPAGVVTTFGGQGPSAASIDGVGTAARFNQPFRMAMDGLGNMYVAESVFLPIRKITPAGVVTTTTSGPVGVSHSDGYAIAADASGNVYFSTSNGVGKMSPAGVVTSLAQIPVPTDMAVDATGMLYITSKNSVLTVSPGGVVTTLAGNGNAGFSDGLGATASFSAPVGIAVDAAGNVYVADSGNDAVRKITPQGQVTTLARSGFTYPIGLALDGAGNVYVTADAANTGRPYSGAVVKISSSGAVTTVVGGPLQLPGYANGSGDAARFNVLTGGIVVDGVGNVYVADILNNDIRKISH